MLNWKKLPDAKPTTSAADAPATPAPTASQAPRAGNPYKARAPYSFWRSAVAGVAPFALDPVTRVGFKIGRDDKVATAGSCFAQHISRNLAKNGFRYFVAEQAPAGMDAALAQEKNYGVFSARFGNLYTARQLRQLIERAFGKFEPQLVSWTRGDGRYVDPFRPQIDPAGYASEAEMRAERDQHLADVRCMFEQLDVFVFTLGLTETWIHKADGAVVPVAPGVSGGEWDPSVYAFHNLSAAEVVTDMLAAIDLMREVNPRARVLLTVSPVPLIATYRDQHVLLSNTYSKAVLRVAAEEIAAARDDVAYFPSYEIITSLTAGNAYYLDDLRSIDELGVKHVMRVFFRHLVADGAPAREAPRGVDVSSEIASARKIVCDEEAIDR